MSNYFLSKKFHQSIVPIVPYQISFISRVKETSRNMKLMVKNAFYWRIEWDSVKKRVLSGNNRKSKISTWFGLNKGNLFIIPVLRLWLKNKKERRKRRKRRRKRNDSYYIHISRHIYRITYHIYRITYHIINGSVRQAKALGFLHWSHLY